MAVRQSLDVVRSDDQVRHEELGVIPRSTWWFSIQVSEGVVVHLNQSTLRGQSIMELLRFLNPDNNHLRGVSNHLRGT